MNGMRVFAENLRYADSAASKNLIGQTSCYNGESKNCEIGGRYYAWSAAMDLNGKWNSASASSLIGAQHRGICPEGWHIPDTTEWQHLLESVDGPTALQAKGFAGFPTATDASGFSALAGSEYRPSYYYTYCSDVIGEFAALFWTAPVYKAFRLERDTAYIPEYDGICGYPSIRCIQDD